MSIISWRVGERAVWVISKKKSCMGKRAENNSARGAMWKKNILNNLKGEKVSCLQTLVKQLGSLVKWLARLVGAP